MVTPIDWKRTGSAVGSRTEKAASQHSMVTPIDWKLLCAAFRLLLCAAGHHSMVIPIDWKRDEAGKKQV